MINLQGYIGFAAGLFVAGLVSYGYTSYLNIRHGIEKASIQRELEAKFTEQKLKSEGSSREYQKQVHSLNKLLDNVKRVHTGQCVYVTTPSGSSNGAGTGNVNVRRVDANTLIDYGGKCERLRLQLISLQGWLSAQ